ncbi:MAG: hypothetical protein LGR52_03045 [Candidatus Thiosymbion ectosymbiont of Robbea hypermnestra]|nr:hypothetical protein [Candidatus Thiosymbion ectosymbiont of Robbea hypermnestra]
MGVVVHNNRNREWTRIFSFSFVSLWLGVKTNVEHHAGFTHYQILFILRNPVNPVNPVLLNKGTNLEEWLVGVGLRTPAYGLVCSMGTIISFLKEWGVRHGTD